MTESEIIKTAFDNIPKESKIYIEKMSDMCDRIEYLLRSKNISYSEAAKMIGASEEEFMDWFTTIYNFRLRDICVLEAMFGESILLVAQPTVLI